MYGYATKETPELLPIPFAVATRFINLLQLIRAPMLLPDAKAQVSYDYESGRITTFLCSVQHTSDSSMEDFRPIIESLMAVTAAEYGLASDFEKLINPTGRFVVGGSMADCGVTGRKLACDTYGGIGRIGGGALSGKDPSYAIGRAEPVSVKAETFGTGVARPGCIDSYISGNYDLTPGAIIRFLHLLEVDYNRVSCGGHFGKPGLPWELDDEEINLLFGGK